MNNDMPITAAVEAKEAVMKVRLKKMEAPRRMGRLTKFVLPQDSGRFRY